MDAVHGVVGLHTVGARAVGVGGVGGQGVGELSQLQGVGASGVSWEACRRLGWCYGWD